MERANVLMAGPEKRMAGSCIKWNEVYINAYLSNQVIPPDKALKALATPAVVTQPGAPLELNLYHSLMGRLENFRGIAQGRRISTNGRYSPFPVGRFRPRGSIAVRPSSSTARELGLLRLVRAQAEPARAFQGLPPLPPRFSTYLAPRGAYLPTPTRPLLGAPVPGLGGNLHGKNFSFPLPVGMLGYAIPQLEFLGIIPAAPLLRPLL